MNTPNIFPIRRDCYDHYGWADGPALAKRIWLRIRMTVAPDQVWYGVSMRIDSAQKVTLFVYDMADFATGGIGKQVFECGVPRDLMTPDECAMLDAELLKVMTSYAESELDKQEAEARQQRVIALRKQLFNV